MFELQLISFEFMLEQFSLDINAAKTTLKYALEYFFPSSLSRRCKVRVVNDRCRTTTNWFDWLNRRFITDSGRAVTLYGRLDDDRKERKKAGFVEKSDNRK